ncbi:MAG: fibronectin type III domain-containing protein, partial [Chitinophagia bacterium]
MSPALAYDTPAPVQVPGLSNVLSVEIGQSSICVVVQGGSSKCWGSNYEGRLGNGSEVDSDIPVAVLGASGVAEVDLGSSHACTRILSSGVQCWGYNGQGQIGALGLHHSSTPLSVSLIDPDSESLLTVSDISTGDLNSCAIVDLVNVECWGWVAGVDGLKILIPYLQTNGIKIASAPGAVSGLRYESNTNDSVTVSWSAGTDGGSAITDYLVEYSASGGSWIRFDDGVSSATSVTVTGLVADPAYKVRVAAVNAVGAGPWAFPDELIQVASGPEESCALVHGGSVVCWGRNEHGEL